MAPIRILLVAPKGLLRDLIVQELSPESRLSEPRVELIQELEDDSKLADAMAETEVDFVIACLRKPELSPTLLALLTAKPLLRILGVVEDGRKAFLYQLRPMRSFLGTLSKATLINAVVTAPGAVGASRGESA